MIQQGGQQLTGQIIQTQDGQVIVYQQQPQQQQQQQQQPAAQAVAAPAPAETTQQMVQVPTQGILMFVASCMIY